MVSSSGVLSLLQIAPSHDCANTTHLCNCTTDLQDEVSSHHLMLTSSSNKSQQETVTESMSQPNSRPDVVVSQIIDTPMLQASEERRPHRKPLIKTYSSREISKHSTAEDAWIVVDGNVYNVTEFLDCHPGGADIILEHIGENDLSKLMRDSDNPNSHNHSEAAFRILSHFLIGTVESTHRKKDDKLKLQLSSTESKTFEVDLTKPLVFQVGHLGSRYQQWVHDPIVCKESPRFFQSNFAELLTQTKWWMIPIVWLPFFFWMESVGIRAGYTMPFMIFLMLAGAMIWTLLEYAIHRFVFHMKTSSYWGNTLHYLLHGFHHKHPMDGSRLVFPPALSAPVILLIWVIAGILAPYTIKAVMTGGGLLAYIIYDLTHYYLHFGVAFTHHFRQMKRYHLNHHFKVQTDAFGITSTLWDRIFATVPAYEAREYNPAAR